jgi:ABC-2 type transport system permease protein
LIKLVYNEMTKLLGKRKILIVTMIMAVLISLFTYAQMREADRLRDRFGDTDWRTSLQQQIVETQNRLSSNRISDEWKAQLRVRLAQQQYYLEQNVNPNEPGAPTFIREIIENAIHLLLPLMIMVIAADLVSSEHSGGTIKLLLTRPVNRWKILLSKYITLVLSVSMIILLFGLLAYIISGSVFGYQGWKAPVLTGFAMEGDSLNTSDAYLVPQWQYILKEFGLAWFVALIIDTLSFMLSVLMKSTAAGMGVMLAFLISGTILSNMVSSWESAKYLFMVNLQLIDYLEGAAPPVESMTLGFSLGVLAVWGAGALLISFLVFTKRDVY